MNVTSVWVDHVNIMNKEYHPTFSSGRREKTYKFLLIIVLILIVGCKKDNSPTNIVEGSKPLPKVILSQTNYQEADIQAQVSDPTFLKQFREAYEGKYSDMLKAGMVMYMYSSAQLIGLDFNELKSCLDRTGQTQHGIISLPIVAERAKYNGINAWIFHFIWGVDTNDLGHFKCYVMSTETSDTLLFITCL